MEAPTNQPDHISNHSGGVQVARAVGQVGCQGSHEVVRGLELEQGALSQKMVQYLDDRCKVHILVVGGVRDVFQEEGSVSLSELEFERRGDIQLREVRKEGLELGYLGCCSRGSFFGLLAGVVGNQKVEFLHEV